MRSIRYRILETAVRLTGYKKLFRLDAQRLSTYIEKKKANVKYNQSIEVWEQV